MADVTDYRKLVEDAANAAAQRTRVGVKSPQSLTGYGRGSAADRGGDLAANLITGMIPQSPADLAMWAAAGPFGKVARTALGAAGATGAVMDPTPAEGGPSKVVKLLPSMLAEQTGPKAAEEFRSALEAAKKASPQGGAVDVLKLKDYKNSKLYMDPEGQTGFAITQTGKDAGNAHSFFKHPDAPYSGAASALAERSAAEGGKKLDVWDTNLSPVYNTAGGYQAVARVPFSKVSKPKDWNKEAFAKFEGQTPTFETRVKDIKVGGPGEPDLIGMVRNPPTPVEDLPVRSYRAMQQVQDLAEKGRFPTVFVPAKRVLSPQIYDDPREIVRRALERIAPESEALQRVFPGYGREAIYEGVRGREKQFGLGDLPNPTSLPTNPKGSRAIEDIMTPQNEKRIEDALYEASKEPKLMHGPYGWYFQDPHYANMVDLYGQPLAQHNFPKWEMTQGFSSPGSAVDKEITRGTTAWQAMQEGWFPDYVKYGSMKKGREIPPDVATKLQGVPGMLAHQSQVKPMQSFLDFIEANKDDPLAWQRALNSIKTGPYTQALMVPQVGYSWRNPTLDAHMVTDLGIADVRGGQTLANFKKSITPSELAQAGPWFSQRAANVGMNPVGAQGVVWTMFGPASGVKSKLGAPKLELQAINIAKRAIDEGKSVEQVLREGYLGKGKWVVPLAAAPAVGAALNDYAAPEVTVY